MGKNDFLTPKAIANRIKAKGLQKLRWYCQMCQKQCRDENGFKCHCMSESHQRQMQVFGMNPHRFVDGFSEEFQHTFMEHLKRAHRFSRVAATVVYNEYIADKHHVHMNSTKWLTLTEFVKHLGREGLCKVEDTPKGWFMTYIDRESETVFKEKQKLKRERADMAEEERHEKEIQDQIERAKGTKTGGEGPSEVPAADTQPKELQRDPESGEKIAFSMGLGPAPKKANKSIPVIAKSALEEDELEQLEAAAPARAAKRGEEVKQGRPKGGVIEELILEQERAKEKTNRKDYWLAEGIVVKVMSKALKDKGLYKQKGVVQRVIDRYVGEIKMLEGGLVVRVDQAELETVIPALGGLVLIVNGAYRGSIARLLAVDTDNFCAKVQIGKGAYDGRILPKVEYEDLCKLHKQ